MMTRNEIIDLLSVISAYDNRNASQAAVLAWEKAAELGRWTFSEALDAVHAHFTVSTAFLMPAHITDRIRAARQDAAMRQPVVTPPNQISQDRLTALISSAFRAINQNGDTERDKRRAALTRTCAFCAAPPGSPCTRTTASGHIPRSRIHPSRLDPDHHGPVDTDHTHEMGGTE